MNESFTEIVGALSQNKTRVCISAAAGCGKTEAIVQAVMKSEGKQLILTHTNAGVAALRSRMRKNSVPESKYRIFTIAGWLLGYCSAYKVMSGLVNSKPYRSAWNLVYPAAIKLFNYPFVKDILKASYSGLFVDEYQDCTAKQHNIVMMISEHIPVRVLGDPLQGIFGFNLEDPLVSWETDVENHFEVLPDLKQPFRWTRTEKNPDANQELGEQLTEIREKLIKHQSINLENYSQVKYYPWSQDKANQLCKDYLNLTGKIAGIHASVKGTYLDLQTAERLNGSYQYIEEMDCYSLFEIAQKVDYCHNSGICIRKTFELFLKQGISDYANYQPDMQEYLLSIDNKGLSILPEIINFILRRFPVYRKELFIELRKATEEYLTGKYSTFYDAAYYVRSKTRLIGRQMEKRIISRTLLIKGLEFDHVLVLNAGEMQNTSHPYEHLYVALTRASKSLTVLASSPQVNYR